MNLVISFSLYGSRRFYCEGALRNAELAKTIYPGWRCRFYVGSTVPQHYLDELRRLGAEIYPVIKNLGPMYGRYWRLWVAGDPSVTRFVVRDVDSRLNPREKAAVDEWMASGKSFHVMRDSTQQQKLMLAGMWGGAGGKLPDIAQLIDAWGKYDQEGQCDQFMSEIIFPRIRRDCICHDSIGYYGDGRPFPPHEPLEGTGFIGERVPVDGPQVDIWRRAAELDEQVRVVKIARASLDDGYQTTPEFDRAARLLLPEIADMVVHARELKKACDERLKEIQALKATSDERLCVIDALEQACRGRENTIDALKAGREAFQTRIDLLTRVCQDQQTAMSSLQASSDKLTAACEERLAEIGALKAICDERQALIETLGRAPVDVGSNEKPPYNSEDVARSRSSPSQFFDAVSGRTILRRVKRLLRPNLGRFEQYRPRPLVAPSRYQMTGNTAQVPTIAIVTPTLNQNRFIGQTIASVLEQSYPGLSYAVQDGGSTDGTVATLESRGNALSWSSQIDGGQAEAINRGFARVQGDVMAWLNSDDILLPGTLAYVADYFRKHPKVDMIYGNRIFIDAAGLEVGRCVLPGHDPAALKFIDYVPQETLFWRRRVWDALRSIDTSFHYALDWDFILRAQDAGFEIRHVPRFLGCFRVHDGQKTSAIQAVGHVEMQRLRLRSLGKMATAPEISRGVRPYLLRHIVVDRLYRLVAGIPNAWGIVS